MLVDKVATIATDSDRERAGVRNRHTDGVHPGHRADGELVGSIEYGVCEGLPREVWLVPCQQQELLTESIARKAQLETRRRVAGEVVLIKRDDGATGPVIKQHVVIENQHWLQIAFDA